MKKVSSWLMQELLRNDGVQRAVIKEHGIDDAIFRVNDPGDYLAVLLSGCIEIRKGDKTLTVIEPGSIFGEMGLIDGKPRVADAIATAPSRVAEIREGQFMALMEKTPYFALEIMRLLTDRLRRQIET